MAKNRTSILNPLEGLTNLTQQAPVAEEKHVEPANTDNAKNEAETTGYAFEKASSAPVRMPGKEENYREIKPRKGVGRPKDEGEFQKICIRLTQENYAKARVASGKYGGVTALINYLIENTEF